MKRFKYILFTLLLIASSSAFATRELVPINDDWQFRFSHQVEQNSSRRVDLPHTWNDHDALSGKQDYKRGIGNYVKSIFIEPKWSEKRIFIRFNGAGTVTNLLINGKQVGEHRGAYGAFIFDITDKVNYGQKNEFWIRVNNAEQLDIMPLVGDFNFYGGIYRDLNLLVLDKVSISPMDYASSGVYLIQNNVSKKRAEVTAKVILSNADSTPKELTLRLTIKDGTKQVCRIDKAVSVKPNTDLQSENIDFALSAPRLWNGVADPFMYSAEVSLIKDGETIDEISEPLGLRYFHVDANQGFFLNGNHLSLRGVCRHQDRAAVGNALRREHHEEDAAIISEMGANAIRLSHYPQDKFMCELMDKNGIVAWAEIPFVGPGGYMDKGFIDQSSFRDNGKQQLTELIKQYYNHPSICFWGLFNELNEKGDNPVEYVKELRELARQLDPTRPTTSASNQEGSINFVTDLIAWNRYDGWYGRTPATLATWLDKTHKESPDIKIGISEYGAGASIYHQQDTLVQSKPNSWWHPENWQTEYHIRNWEIISSRRYVWGSFIWNLFDFGAAHRTEGDRAGINDKGLVTYDRKVKKDAFFFYKANWNSEPMVYISSRRDANRTREITDIMVFTNCGKATLYVNGKNVASASADRYNTVIFKGVKLDRGANTIEVVANTNRGTYKDSCLWQLTKH